MGPKFGHFLMKTIQKTLVFAEKIVQISCFGLDVILSNKTPLYRQQILKFWDPWQNLSKITFFAGKRCGGAGICPKGLISTKFFALALTVLEIFA